MNEKKFNQQARIIGAQTETSEARAENDFYATDPIAIEELMKIEKLCYDIWEPACGMGHLAEPLVKAGYHVIATDLIDRGYGNGGVDFLKQTGFIFCGDIITNPPYKLAEKFIRHGLEIIPEGYKLCLFMKLTFLEGKKRQELFKEYPPKRVWVSSSRINCATNGNFEGTSSMMAQAWYIWEKGYQGPTTLGWFN